MKIFDLFLVLVVIAAFGWKFYQDPGDHFDASFERRLKQELEQRNQHGAIMADEITRLDRTEVGPGRRITFYYTVVTLEKSLLNMGKVDQAKGAVREKIISEYKADPKSKALRDNKAEPHFRYYDKKGELLFEIVITPADL